MVQTDRRQGDERHAYIVIDPESGTTVELCSVSPFDAVEAAFGADAQGYRVIEIPTELATHYHADGGACILQWYARRTRGNVDARTVWQRAFGDGFDPIDV